VRFGVHGARSSGFGGVAASTCQCPAFSRRACWRTLPLRCTRLTLALPCRACGRAIKEFYLLVIWGFGGSGVADLGLWVCGLGGFLVLWSSLLHACKSQFSVPKCKNCLKGGSRELGFGHGVEGFIRETRDKNKENHADKQALPRGLALCAPVPRSQPVAETARSRLTAGAKARLCGIVVSSLGAVRQSTLARRLLAGKHLAGEVLEKSLRLGLPRVALPGSQS
jgi:hypothetical protein